MEDIRFINKKDKKQIKFINLFVFIQKNWFKILIGIFIVLLIIFPTFFGNIIGTWLNDFVISFLSKITF